MGLGSGSGQLGCGGTCMKYILFIFNFVFFLSGAAILGVAIWIKVDDSINKYLDIIEWDDSNELLSVASWVLIGVGAFIFFVGFCGCCGACRESTCLLNTYAALMIIVLILEVAAAVLAIVFSSQLGDEVKSNMRRQVKEFFKTEEQGAASDPITLAWVSLQKNLKCCGGESYTDYDGSYFIGNTTDPTVRVPESCCKNFESDDFDYAKCNLDADNDNTGADSDLYHTACFDTLVDWIKDKSNILIGIGFGLAALEILGIVFACCVSSGIKEESRYN